DVNNNGTAADAVYAAYDPNKGAFVGLDVPNPGGVGNQPYFQTLFNNYNQTFNGVSHHSWTPSAAGLARPGGNIINTAGDLSYTDATTVQTQPGCSPPDCTYDEISSGGLFHQVVFASDGAPVPAVWEKYDNYVINDNGKIARTSDFAVGSF